MIWILFFFDYGCADGSLLKEIGKRIKGCNLIGYDIDDTMISKAKENVPDCVFDESFCSCKKILCKEKLC